MTHKQRGIRFYNDSGSVDFHTCRDLGVFMTNKIINFPEPKTNTISIRGRDGDLDISDAHGRMRYNNRVLNFSFTISDNSAEAAQRKLQKIASLVHGKRLNIIEDDDVTHYYMGRCTISEPTIVPRFIRFRISCNCDPFRYDNNDCGLWEWDSFDFENDVATEYEDITFQKREDVLVVAGDKLMYPVITCNTDMQMMYNNEIYQLHSGVNTPEIILDVGVNTLSFLLDNGIGVISIQYRGGYL